MKNCKVYNHVNNIEAEAVIIDNNVLFAIPIIRKSYLPCPVNICEIVKFIR